MFIQDVFFFHEHPYVANPRQHSQRSCRGQCADKVDLGAKSTFGPVA